MGATNFETVSFGRTVAEAYRRARDEARAENGSQDGYSGDIQTTRGYREFRVPDGTDLRKLARDVDRMTSVNEILGDPGYYDEADVAEARDWKAGLPGQYRWRVGQIADVAGDKYGDAVAVQLTGARADEFRARRELAADVRVWVFFGTAAY